MRRIALFLPSFLLALVMASAPAQAQWCHDIDTTWWCGDPNACEGVCGQPGSDCTTPCTDWGGSWTTCGGGGNDLDFDGIANGSDNCACNANAGQADCDQDGMGDVCDPVDEKWVPISSVTYCDWDMDWHFGYGEVEKYGTQRYRELCSNNQCNNTVQMEEKRCWEPFDDNYCCEIHFGQDCLTDNQCPADNCPF